jgi:hypothetical protein
MSEKAGEWSCQQLWPPVHIVTCDGLAVFLLYPIHLNGDRVSRQHHAEFFKSFVLSLLLLCTPVLEAAPPENY